MEMNVYGLNIDTHNVGYLIIFLVASFTTLVSIIMLWHWHRYGFKARILVLAELVYLPVTAILLLSALVELNRIL